MTANEWFDYWRREEFAGKDPRTYTPEQQQERQKDRQTARLLALEKMVFAVIEATAIQYSARMPDPMPDLRHMAASSEPKHHFRLEGMYGGFSLELHDAAGHDPYVLAECWCRVVGGSQLLRRITAKTVEVVSEGLF